MENEIYTLFTGYSHMDSSDPSCTLANCTCTLIKSRSRRNIVIDTMTAWDGDKLTAALRKHNLQPQNIHAVICTHGHSDHVGCNYLFRNAKWHVVGTSISNADKYLSWGDNVAVADSASVPPFQVDGQDVTVHRTPGHTLSCVSVVVRDSQIAARVGICGDLFERVEDILDSSIWLQSGSENPKLQRESRLRMAEMCEYIIPGHGPGFTVTKPMIEKLRKDLETC